MDWRRNAVFAAFGFGYLGCVQYFVYVQLFARSPPGTGEPRAELLCYGRRLGL